MIPSHHRYAIQTVTVYGHRRKCETNWQRKFSFRNHHLIYDNCLQVDTVRRIRRNSHVWVWSIVLSQVWNDRVSAVKLLLGIFCSVMLRTLLGSWNHKFLGLLDVYSPHLPFCQAWITRVLFFFFFTWLLSVLVSFWFDTWITKWDCCQWTA